MHKGAAAAVKVILQNLRPPLEEELEQARTECLKAIQTELQAFISEQTEMFGWDRRHMMLAMFLVVMREEFHYVEEHDRGRSGENLALEKPKGRVQ